MSSSLIFNESIFEEILRSSGVESLTDAAAQKVLAQAKATAPVDTGAYKRGLQISHKNGRTRKTALVIGTDSKTMLIESKTGNLARALKGI